MQDGFFCLRKTVAFLMMLSISFFFSSDLISQSNPRESAGLKLMEEAEALYRNGDDQEALKKLNEVLDLVISKENLERLYYQLSYVYYAADNKDKTIEFLRKLFRINPKRSVEKDRFPSGYIELYLLIGKEMAEQAGMPKTISGKEKSSSGVKKGNKTFLYILGGLAVVGIIVAVVLITKKKNDSKSGSMGSIQVESNPTGAQVYLDGNLTEKVTNCLLSNISPGSHTIKLVLAGYSDLQQTVTVQAGQTAKMTGTFSPLVIIEPEMVRIPGGTFMMGSESLESSANEQPVHQVILSSFEIGKYEVTQAEWFSVMGTKPSYYSGDILPVDTLSWDEVQIYLQRLNAATGKSYRLPTEAEWEYACRAGTTGDRYGELSSIAWYSLNSGSQTHPVGFKAANNFGLFDTLGNVNEWCSDFYGPYSVEPATNPKGPSSGSDRVFRGGHFMSDINYTRAPSRSHTTTSARYSNFGFRIARD